MNEGLVDGEIISSRGVGAGFDFLIFELSNVGGGDCVSLVTGDTHILVFGDLVTFKFDLLFILYLELIFDFIEI